MRDLALIRYIALLLLVLGLVACGDVSPTPPPAATVPLSATLKVISLPPTISLTAVASVKTDVKGTEFCRNDALRLAIGWDKPGETLVSTVIVRNSGKSACAEGSPYVELYDNTGQRLPVIDIGPGKRTPSDGGNTPFIIVPGQTASFFMVWQNWNCKAHQAKAPLDIHFTFPSDDVPLIFHAAYGGDLPCDVRDAQQQSLLQIGPLEAQAGALLTATAKPNVAMATTRAADYLPGLTKTAVAIATFATQPPPPPTPTLSPGVQPCRLSDLTFPNAASNGATGHVLIVVTVMNSGNARCNLPERPNVTLIIEGVQQPLQLKVFPLPPLGQTPIRELQHGQEAQFVLDWTNWCSVKTGAVIVAVKLANNGTPTNVLVPDLPPSAARCDAPEYTSALGVSPFTAPNGP